MNKVCVLIIIVLAFVSVKSQQLIDGESLDNIQIGKSTIYEVIANYGSDYKLKKNSDYSNVLVYEKLGLGFYSCQADSKQEIFAIVMQPPFSVQTSKGIVLGKSTFKELYELYGKWSMNSAGFEYEDIGFYFDTHSEVFEGFESDNMNFAQAKKPAIEPSVPLQNQSYSTNDNLLISSNLITQSNNSSNVLNNNSIQNNQSDNYSISQNKMSNNNSNASKSKNKTNEEKEFKSEIELWGNKIVNKIKLIEKGRLRQCHVDFRIRN